MKFNKPLIVVSNGKQTSVFFGDEYISTKRIVFSANACPREVEVEFGDRVIKTPPPDPWETFSKSAERILGFKIHRQIE